MFGIGGFELFIILVFAFLIFGPEKLPEIGTMIGRAIAKFRDAQQEMSETLGDEKLFDPSNPDEPFKDPMEALDRMAQRQEERQKAKGKGDTSAADRIAAEVAEKGEISEDEALEQEIKERAEAAVEKICGHDAGKDSATEENACKKAPDGQNSDASLAEDGKATDGSTVSECPSANKGKEN